MNLSQTGLDLIKGFEGLRLTAYKAVNTEKYMTIGYGHYGSDVRAGQKISKAEAESLLKKDVEKFVDGVDKLVKVDVNQNQFDAMVSLAYNIGLGAFEKSTLLELVNKKKFDEASDQFPRWNKSSGVVLSGLVKRRAKEKALFDKAVKTTSTAKKTSSSSPSSKIKAVGQIVVDGVQNFTPIYEETDGNSKQLGRANKGDQFDIAGSVTGWYEVIYENKRAYIRSKYCSRV